MTAVTTRSVADTDSLLRFALRADATLCGAVGLVVAMAADPLSRLSGLSPTSEWIAGAALVGYGAVLYLAAGMRDVRRVGFGVLVGNVAFAVLVVIVLIAGWLPLTPTGTVSALAFAAATLAFAYAQYLGVRRFWRIDAPPHDWSGAAVVRGCGVGSGTVPSPTKEGTVR